MWPVNGGAEAYRRAGRAGVVLGPRARARTRTVRGCLIGRAGLDDGGPSGDRDSL